MDSWRFIEKIYIYKQRKNSIFSLQKMLDLSYDADCGGQSSSPSKDQLAPHRNSIQAPVCVINPHHPNIAARASSVTNPPPNVDTTPTSPRPSATDLVQKGITWKGLCGFKPECGHLLLVLHCWWTWNTCHWLSWNVCIW